MDFHLENFDGPLDLLLHLIAKNKVSIYDIPIAVILDQYMEVLHAAEAMDLDIAGDFVAMAAQLVYIKSKMLLPRHEEDEEDDPRAGLVEMLLEYQRLKEITPYFREKGELGRDIFVKPPENLGEAPKEYRQSVNDLVRAANNMLRKAQRRIPPPASAFSGIVGREPVPVETRITAILRRFIRSVRVPFRRLFDDAKNRSEIVATFLAVLEAAAALENLYDFENRGLMLLRLEDKLQLCSRPLYADAARRVTESRKPPSLSPAALEVLTIVAYRQPVTRAFIDQLRGVDSGGTVAGLAEKGLIEEAGRMDVPGRPILYRTTEIFLRTFALSSLSELPALPSLEENEQMELDLDGRQPEAALEGQLQIESPPTRAWPEETE